MVSRENDGAHYMASLMITQFDCDAGEITRLLGIEPDASWTSGEPVGPGDSIVHRENGWSIHAPDTPDDSAEAQVVALCRRIEPHVARFARLPCGTRVGVAVWEWRDADESGGRIPCACIAQLAAIGAEIVFMSSGLPDESAGHEVSHQQEP